MVDATAILTWVGILVCRAEEDWGPKEGAQKRGDVISSTVAHLEREKLIGHNPGPDPVELIKLIGALVDAVVSLLNFLGIFKKDKPSK